MRVPPPLCPLTALIFAAVTAIAQPSIPFERPSTRLWTPNGIVSAIIARGSRLYVGGRFSAWGPYNAGRAALDPRSGRPLEGFPAFNGLSAVVEDGDGGWYVADGGVDTPGGAVDTIQILHLRSDGSVARRLLAALGVRDSAQNGRARINAMAARGTRSCSAEVCCSGEPPAGSARSIGGPGIASGPTASTPIRTGRRESSRPPAIVST